MSTHAFVDESIRNGTYLLAAAIVDPKDLALLRGALRTLLLPGQAELHFKKETPARRRLIMARLCAEGARVRIYRRTCGKHSEVARQECLAALTRDLLDSGAVRLVLDTREDRDINDVHTIRTALGKLPKESQMTYEHMVSTQERLLWIADAVAWSYGAGGDWLRRAQRVIADVVDLDDWS
ncbi:hypothetical protein GCM10010185_63370 [Saccharothrix coeruleofusca]|uniref:DUF3800 domain-containing protein n=1 Tax=Saccharothrix coeruleofusca TaxID=33919 RepID=A0A918EGF3_9PSEU|nr:hypothetical protein [Saccharothrix coeruleofusca]GGP80791.1 hypothetical protein GCM10010185_63370 [Saccharothrix coeruleofusca]